jgi:hypothetical protein
MFTAVSPEAGSTTMTVVPSVVVLLVPAAPGAVQFGTAALAGAAIMAYSPVAANAATTVSVAARRRRELLEWVQEGVMVPVRHARGQKRHSPT